MTLPNDGVLPHELTLPPGFTLGEYRLIRVLGRGGFGITYLAEDIRTNLAVAIKELLPTEFATRGDGSTVVLITRSAKAGFSWAKQRFVEEARILARLNHPNIARGFGLMELNGTAYLAMEFIRGCTLREWVWANPGPTEAQLRELLLPLMAGLEYVHQEGLLHRDISPDNIMIRETGSPVLIDFGSARVASTARRNFTNLVRHGFSSIEQYQCNTPQAACTDIYSLAGVMIYAITGETPPQSVDRCCDDDPYQPLVRRVRTQYSHRFLRALDSAFAVKPRDRPQTITDWRRILTIQPKQALIANLFHHGRKGRLLLG